MGNVEGVGIVPSPARERYVEGRGSGSDSSELFIRSYSADTSGNVYVTGVTRGDLRGRSQGDSDAFLRVYTSDGALRDVLQFGGAYTDHANAVAAGVGGAVNVVGARNGRAEGCAVPPCGREQLGSVRYDAFIRAVQP